MAEDKNAVVLKKNIGDQVIARVNSLSEAGFTMPKDYSYVNAIKMSLLKLQEVKDKTGKPCLSVCTPNSIQTALFKMCCRGLSLAFNQCYAIVRGDTLCIDDSYFGKVLMVKRIFPNWEPNPHVIREGDTFEYAIDPNTGKTKLVKHEQKLENMDKPFIGGYIYLPSKDGDMDLYIMTKKMILTAWSKSASREQATHKAFDEKMVGKTLINSGCNMIINSTPEYQIGLDNEEEEAIENKNSIQQGNKDFTDFEEAEEVIDEHTQKETNTSPIKAGTSAEDESSNDEF